MKIGLGPVVFCRLRACLGYDVTGRGRRSPLPTNVHPCRRGMLMANNYRPDPFRDLFDDKELSSLFDDDDEELADGDFDEDDAEICPGCSGKGRYIGLFEIEDPCQECGGTGMVCAHSSEETAPFPKAGA